MKRIMVTGTDLLSQKDDVTADGLQKVFATNVFGHFLMVRFRNCLLSASHNLSCQVRQLEKKLASQDHPCHIIWSSSQTSMYNNIDLNDIQHTAGLVILVCLLTLL